MQVVHEEEEPLVFSFYQDMSKNPHVIKLMLQLNQAIHKVFSMMNKYLDGWRRYDTVYNLWNPKRKQALDKLAEKKHTCVYFDTRIASYELLAETVRAQPSEKDVDFIRIDCYPVALGIAAQADQWKTDYGAVLHQCSSALLEELCTKMAQVREPGCWLHYKRLRTLAIFAIFCRVAGTNYMSYHVTVALGVSSIHFA